MVSLSILMPINAIIQPRQYNLCNLHKIASFAIMRNQKISNDLKFSLINHFSQNLEYCLFYNSMPSCNAYQELHLNPKNHDKHSSIVQPYCKDDSKTSLVINEGQEKALKAKNDMPNIYDVICEEDQVLITYKHLPYIFKFKYSVLQKLSLRIVPNTPSIARSLLNYLLQKTLCKRFSDKSPYPNRMKYEEKIKFLLRGYQQKKTRKSMNSILEINRYNQNSQEIFFSHQSVRESFYEISELVIARKRLDNEFRMRDLEELILECLHPNTSFKKAKDILENKLKRKQMPWTENMFKDIIYTRDRLLEKYVKPESKEQMGKDIDAPNTSEMNEDNHCDELWQPE